ncbi:MAG: AAA family ATPase [Pirellulales bacterium]
MSKLACLTKGKDRAFPAYPRVDRYFQAASTEDARRRLARCIDRGDGPGLVIGPSGSGKTLLLQLLATQFADRFSVACLTSTPLCTRRALLQAILFELRQPYRDREAGELRLSLVELLLDRQSCPEGLLLLVDEAQLLPVRLLEELRILGNLTCAGEPRVRLVLAGSLQLDELFTAPELEVFNQRLTARCYLAPMGHHETVEFARAQVAASGANPDQLFVPESLDALYQATDGIPRLVNQVCDRALLFAIDRGVERIDKAIIEAAWSDLQQLPDPWGVVHEPTAVIRPEVIEFGSLDDDSDLNMEATELDVDEIEASSGPAMRVFHSQSNEDVPVSTHDELPHVTIREQPVADPFAEPFQDEEVVLDRFASLEAAFHGNTPRVRNRRETGWSQLLRDADTSSTAQNLNGEARPNDGFEDAVECEFDEHLLPQFSRLIAQATDPFTSPSATSPEEPAVLVIEDDAPAASLVNRQVERKEFRQLFASLRGD